ncbi:hypothetical protein DESC_70009 [Desulfosarcina cetonica]|nr:hypothetical protein DESC_70009 [Desulfosarcina cetonica]
MADAIVLFSGLFEFLGLFGANRLEEGEFTRVVDLDHHGTFFRIAVRAEGHCAGDAGVVLDRRQGILDLAAVSLDVTGKPAGVLDRLDHQAQGIPGQRGDVVGGFAIGGGVFVDEGLGGALGTGGGIVGGEVVALAVVTAKAHQVTTAPGIGSQDRLGPAHLLGRTHDQGHFAVVLGSKEHIRAGGHDVGHLGREVLVAGGKALKSHDRPGTVNFLEGGLEKFGQALGIVGGDVVNHGSLFGAQLIGGEIGRNRPLEGIEKAATENIGPIQGGVGIGGPGADHGRGEVVGHVAGRHGLAGGLGPDHAQDTFLGDQLGGDLDRRLGLVFVVVKDELEIVGFATHLDLGRFLQVHLGGVFG